MLRRILVVAIFFSSIMLVYMIRLATLQLFPHAAAAAHGRPAAAHTDWRKTSVTQRQHRLVLDTGRGDFLDRNGRPLTGETYRALAFFPVSPESRREPERQEQEKRLAAVLGIPVRELEAWWGSLKEPAYWRKESAGLPYRLTAEEQDRLKRLSLGGVRVLPYRNRYLSGYYAAQTIGFVSQHPEWIKETFPKELQEGKRSLTEKTGGSGLERSLDRLLRGIGQTTAMYYTDGRNMPLKGLDLRVDGPESDYYPLQVRTTLDLALQQELEAYADRMKLKEGAIVVLDADNADVVAMVSRPGMNPDKLLRSDGSEWTNHALRAAAPGSVFKLVTEAAALEAGVTDESETFTCDGEYGKYGLSCWKEGGHGTLTLREGLAQSCNVVFATLAERLSAEQLQRTALALGIGRKVGWSTDKPFRTIRERLRLLPEEEAGTMFLLPEGGGDREEHGEPKTASEALKRVDGGARAQSGIGQRDVRITPLQAANLVVTLLHGGHVLEPRLVREIRYANGQRMAVLKPREAPWKPYGRIGADTARKVLRGMEAVVDHGTGHSIRDGRWKVAGKSGTAETVVDGKPRNHQWFAGYGPADKPRYAVAVLAENRPPDSSNQATRLFRGVMDLLADAGEAPTS